VSPRPTRQSIAELLAEARARTIALIHPLGDELLNRVYSELLSPLAWDLGHIANFEELWLVQTVGGRAPLHGELGQYYDAIENPRRERGELPILHDAELRAYMAEVRERTLAVLDEVDISPEAEDPLLREGFVYEMLVAHELQHQETMMQLIQMLDAPYRPAEADPDAFGPAPLSGAGGSVRIEAGTREIGAPERGFAYDNERPRHRVELPTFEIDRTPVANATYIEYMGETGAEPPMYWEREGDAWVRTAMGIRVPVDPRLLGGGRRLRPLGRQAPAERVRVGGRAAAAGGRRRRLGVDLVGVPRLPRLHRLPLRGVLRGLLRRHLQGPARRLLDDPPARRPAELPQLGPAPAPPDIRRHPPRLRLKESTA
jgi:hypothetical protein